MSELLVLCYHAISPTWPAALSVTPEAFERQISLLVSRGWAPSTYTRAVCEPPNARTLAVTFDDAFASVARYALPVLRRLGVAATVFAPTEYVSRSAPLAWPGLAEWERGPHAGELRAMTWEQLGELADEGWEIGSHTRTHPHLTALDDAALATELRASRAECADRLGRPVTAIAYPYGDVDARVEAATGAAGYATAAAMAWPSEAVDRLRHPRVGVYHKDSWARFRLKVGSWSRTAYGSRLIALRAARIQRA
jgi:peptidoglycan/xylan/chitin deacetylase (PgdA/CDA1 family)